MKYIDAEKLAKAIEDKGLDCSFALKMERIDILALIDELQQEQPSENLEKAAEDYCKKCNYLNEERDKQADGTLYHSLEADTAIDAFKAGWNAHKEHMMKDAEPAEVGYFNQIGLSILTERSIKRMGFDEGDKVKIIIVKEDGK